MGEIHYPNVEISPVVVKLNSASNTAADYKEIILKNVSTLPVNYHWEFDEAHFFEETIKASSVIQNLYLRLSFKVSVFRLKFYGRTKI